MRKIEARMVEAIRETIADPYLTGQTFKAGNTVVFQTSGGTVRTPNFYRYVEVIFCDTVIALIEPQSGRMTLHSGGYRTVTTKSRLNAILDSMGDNFSIAQDKGEWKLYRNGYFYENFYDGRTFTLTL